MCSVPDGAVLRRRSRHAVSWRQPVLLLVIPGTAGLSCGKNVAVPLYSDLGISLPLYNVLSCANDRC